MLPLSASNRKPRKRKAKDGRPRLSKEIIVAKALEIIDQAGIESFSIRNLAKALKIYPTAIYWYLPNRNTVIGEVIGLVLQGLVPIDINTDWRRGLEKLFRNYRECIRKHPNVAPMIGVQLVSNASLNFGMIEDILCALKKAGFKEAMLPAAYNAVISAMVAFPTQEFALVPADDQDNWADSMRSTIEQIDRDQFPVTAKLLPELSNKSFIMRWENGVTAPMDEGFELFISAFIAGLEKLASAQSE